MYAAGEELFMTPEGLPAAKLFCTIIAMENLVKTNDLARAKNMAHQPKLNFLCSDHFYSR